MSQITKVFARQILDSRGFPTVEVDIITSHGILGRASVPAGVIPRKFEAVEIRDNDFGRYLGKTVSRSISSINKILNEELNGIFVEEQSLIDSIMIQLDGTENRSNLGANTMLGVSLAAAKAAALSCGQPLYRYLGGVNANTLPIPLINVINGGRNADNNLDFSEFLIIPMGMDSFSEALRIGTEVFHNLGKILKQKGYSTNKGDCGGFAPNLKSNEEAVELILEAIQKAGYKSGDEIFLGINASASDFYNSETKNYHLKSNNKSFSSNEMIDYWKQLLLKYPISTLEDGLDQDDTNSWISMNNEIGEQTQIIGSDLFASNSMRLMKGIDEQTANGIVMKLNQVGTLTEVINTIQLAKQYGFTAMLGSRSGETEDTSIVDLSVGLNLGMIKLGGVTQTDRLAKYNQFLRIEEALGGQARFGMIY